MPRQDAPGYAMHAKSRDPFTFQPADDFFADLDGEAVRTHQPVSVSYHAADQAPKPGSTSPIDQKYGRIFRFDDGKYVVIQFLRPRVWRIRFNPRFTAASDYSDFNTRTMIQSTTSKLIDVLDFAEKIEWEAEFKKVGKAFYVLQSVRTDGGERRIVVQLWIQRHPFKVTAVRSVASTGTEMTSPAIQHPALDSPHSIPAAVGHRNVIVWETKSHALQYQEQATVLHVDKPLTAKYLGFGEQGGRSLFKDKTYMNYFNFDNMAYCNVYGEGPTCDAEPLYHSEPYWIQVNAHPGYMTQVGTFVDNYSQVLVDLGRREADRVRVATRFNSFQGLFIAGDDVAHVIQLYTSLIGRPWLRPRYVLGHHQGCYGYDSQELVEHYADQYRRWDFPLDGMHIDVDMQRDYRTFTIDTRPGRFPAPRAMFAKLRAQGIKCSTNITPVIPMRREPGLLYDALESGWAGSGRTGDPKQDNYFVRDVRDDDDDDDDDDAAAATAQPAHAERYVQYGRGTRYLTDPHTERPAYGDDYDFAANRNSGWPFHGGVDYGGGKGSPGFYPNLNNAEVRRWWGRQYQGLVDAGLEFVWQDMTSPCMGQQYGDMKSWPFRLLLDADGWPGDPAPPARQRAIEIWALYSLNLHKATFAGLHRLRGREGRRNFIIGRGSFAGAQRYAGLWTGDNASTWDFFGISVAQVLALGLAGVAISGADVGGFEPAGDADRFADPELLIRWYGAYSLLPWLRNHYVRKGKKWFQEPFEYENYRLAHAGDIPADQQTVYRAVLPATRYLVRLRYSLLQLLYDAMWEHTIRGLPMARAMVVSDPLDPSLFASTEWYTGHQYTVGPDLLVAPVMQKQAPPATTVSVYLPYPNGWFPCNLRPDGAAAAAPGVALAPKVRGGSYIDYDARIDWRDEQLPYITPMYIREGAIIPQMEVRHAVPDRTRPDVPALAQEPPIPITIHVYPGKDNKYSMYIDDGVSRASAPTNDWLAQHEDAEPPAHRPPTRARKQCDAYGDPEARNAFREVQIAQTSVRRIQPSPPFDDDDGDDDDAAAGDNSASDDAEMEEATTWQEVRTITVRTSAHSYFSDDDVRRAVGPEYRLAIWHASTVDLASVRVAVAGAGTADPDSDPPRTDAAARVTLVRVATRRDVRATVVVTTTIS